MTNTSLLDEKIAKSGLRIDFILKKLGISDTAWYKKKNGNIQFKAAEIYVLCDLLNISDEEAPKIFYSKSTV